MNEIGSTPKLNTTFLTILFLRSSISRSSSMGETLYNIYKYTIALQLFEPNAKTRNLVHQQSTYVPDPSRFAISLHGTTPVPRTPIRPLTRSPLPPFPFRCPCPCIHHSDPSKNKKKTMVFYRQRGGVKRWGGGRRGSSLIPGGRGGSGTF